MITKRSVSICMEILVWNMFWEEVLSKLKPMLLFSLIYTYNFIDCCNIYSFHFNMPSVICTNCNSLDIFQIQLFRFCNACLRYICNYWIEDILVDSIPHITWVMLSMNSSKIAISFGHWTWGKAHLFPHKLFFGF